MLPCFMSYNSNNTLQPEEHPHQGVETKDESKEQYLTKVKKKMLQK